MSATKLTVLGGGGFIGGHLVRHLRQHGHDCLVPPRDDESIFREPLGRVIYAIGLTADFRVRPLDTVEAHVCLLRRLLAAGNFDSLTYLSSTRVYVGASDTGEGATLCVNPNDASDLYNLSKLMGESLCLHGGRPGLCVARLSNIVGIRRDPDMFIDQILEEGRRTGKVEFRTSLESRKDYLHIDDAVALIARIALAGSGGIYNVASGEGVANAQIASALAAEMGFEIAVAPGAPTWDFSAIDISRVRGEFGFEPRKFADYFPAFLRDYRRHHHLSQ